MGWTGSASVSSVHSTDPMGRPPRKLRSPPEVPSHGTARRWPVLLVGLAIACSPTPSSPLVDAGSTGDGSFADAAAPGDASPSPDAGSPSTACVSTFPVTPDCKHPPVEAKCKEGFCEIPPGCFVMGSPPCQVGRGPISEPESQVTLTHRFEIAQHETTQEEWMAAGFPNNAVPAKNEPDSYGSCVAPSCPATMLTYFDALDYANVRSRTHSPASPRMLRARRLHGYTWPRSRLRGRARDSGGRLRLPRVSPCLRRRSGNMPRRAGTRTPFPSGDIVAKTYRLHEAPAPSRKSRPSTRSPGTAAPQRAIARSCTRHVPSCRRLANACGGSTTSLETCPSGRVRRSIPLGCALVHTPTLGRGLVCSLIGRSGEGAHRQGSKRPP
jgi:hypothetical protein